LTTAANGAITKLTGATASLRSHPAKEAKVNVRSLRSRARLAGALALAFFLGVCPAALAAPGDLDPSFGGDGMATADLSGANHGRGMAIDGAGRIVVVGNAALVRFNPDGSLDTSFGEDGAVQIRFGAAGSLAYATAIDPLGRIVAAGCLYSSSASDFAVARFNPDGSPDLTFDGDGVTTIDFGGGRYACSRAVALDADGRIVMAGASTLSGAADFAVARLNPDGSPDASFDGDGRALTDLDKPVDEAGGLAIDAAGRIVAAGRTGIYAEGNFDFAVVRYRPDGSLDPDFGGDGIVTTDFAGSNDGAAAVAVDPLDRIVAAGTAGNLDGWNSDFAVARYGPDGSLDPTFDGDGRATADFGGSADGGKALAIDAAGRIVVAGDSRSVHHFHYDFGVARFLPDGSPDMAFGGDGKVTTSFDSDRGYGGHGHSFASGVALDDAGRILVAGSAPEDDFAVARYLSEGGDPTPSPPIDIRPGDPDNVISIGARGKVPVAVLATAQLRAPEEIDRNALAFGRTGDANSLLRRKDNLPNCNM
jgi:uncharacterized delta-60 repeat protein